MFICGVATGYDRSDAGYDWFDGLYDRSDTGYDWLNGLYDRPDAGYNRLMARYDHFENDVPFFIPK